MDLFSSVIANTHRTKIIRQQTFQVERFFSFSLSVHHFAVNCRRQVIFLCFCWWKFHRKVKSVKIKSNEMKNWKKIDLFVDLICEIYMRWQELHWLYWFQRLEASFGMPLYQIQTSKWCHSQSIRSDPNPLQYFKLVCTWEKNPTSLLHSKQVYWCLSLSILFRACESVCVYVT